MNKIIILVVIFTIATLISTMSQVLDRQNNIKVAINNEEPTIIFEEITELIDSGDYEILGDEDLPIYYDEFLTQSIVPEEVPELFDEIENVEEKLETKSQTKKTTSSASTTTKTTNTQTTKKAVSKYNMPYYIKINRSQNVVNIYEKGSGDEYDQIVKAMVCSIGTSTPKAGSKYKITSYRRVWNGLKGGVYGQYAVQITGNILFHSVPYTAKDKSTLEYWEYDKLGTKASMGCIRLTVKDAKWIYDYVAAGTYVEFYEDEDPGPLGKPVAQKISENELCRGWDPTDNVEGNPWIYHTYELSDELSFEEEPSGNIDVNNLEVIAEVVIDESDSYEQPLDNNTFEKTPTSSSGDEISSTDSSQEGEIEVQNSENTEKVPELVDSSEEIIDLEQPTLLETIESSSDLELENTEPVENTEIYEESSN